MNVYFFRALFLVLSFALSWASFADIANRKLDPKKIKKISYLMADSSGVGKTTLGHSFLRFSYGDKLSNSDPVVEFVADVAPIDLEYFRAMGMVPWKDNYGTRVVLAKYSFMKKYHIEKQDQDLVSFVLDLSQEQMEKIVERMNVLLEEGVERDYTFFFNNCASIISQELATLLEMDVDKGMYFFPLAIPRKLRQLGLVKEVHTDDSISHFRENYVAEKLPEIDFADNDPLILHNIVEQLTSTKVSERILAYSKLHMIRPSLSSQMQSKLSLFCIKLLLRENSLIKNYVLRYFTSRKNVLVEVPIAPIKVRTDLKEVKNMKFVVDGEDVFVKYLAKAPRRRQQLQENTVSGRVLIPELKYRDGKILNAAGETVLYRFSNDIVKDEFYSPFTYFKFEVLDLRRTNVIRVILAQEVNPKPLARTFDSSGALAVQNGDFGLPMCNAHANLTRKLNNNVIYRPDMPALAEDENIQIIRDTMAGKIAVIPGYSNANEFTASMDAQRLATEIYNWHKVRFSYANNFKSYLKETPLTKDNIYIVKNMIELGIPPILSYEVKNKIGHAIVVTGVKEDEDSIYLQSYDPNLKGHLSMSSSTSFKTHKREYYMIDKKTNTLKSASHGSGITKIRLSAVNLQYELDYQLVLQDKSLKQKAIDTAKAKSIYSFRLFEFY